MTARLFFLIGILLYGLQPCFSQEKSKKDSIRTLQSIPPETKQNYQTKKPSSSEESPQLPLRVTSTITLKTPSYNEYWLIPGYSPYPMYSPIAHDYAVYSELGPFNSFSTHQTYPLIGSMTYMSFAQNINLTQRLDVSYGFYLSKYNIGKKGLIDFGLNFEANYTLYHNIGLGFLNQSSFREHIIDAPPETVSLFPHNRTEININLKPAKNVKFKVFLSNDP